MEALRRAGVALIVAVLAFGLAAAIAGAKKKHRKAHAWGSKITLEHPSAQVFTGTVDSGLAACSQARLVNVFFTDASSGQTALLSVQRTDGKGRFRVDLTQAAYAGVYQAQAAQEKHRINKTLQTCTAADSPIFGI